MSSQVMKPGSISLSPSERLAIRFEPRNTANAQYYNCQTFLSAKKVLYEIFSDEGVAIKVPVKKDKSTTGKYYKDKVLKKLKKYYQKRRPTTGFKHVHLLHDNAPAHTSAIVTAFLKKEKVSVLLHPLYSPDLAPCDFFLFPKLKSFLAGRKYQSRYAL